MGGSSSKKSEGSPSPKASKARDDAADCAASVPQSSATSQPPKASYSEMVKQFYDALVRSIIRPPRAQYSMRDLGPAKFTYGGRQHHRRDFQLVNARGLTLQCSHWEPLPTERPAPRMPCVVYMHGNSSSRAEGMDILCCCLARGITVLALDFAGSGRSDGEYVSLGYFEKFDLETVVSHLKNDEGVSAVAAWGHSMGAATALLHAARHPTLQPDAPPPAVTEDAPTADLSLAGIVVDSSFTDLETLAHELVKDGKLLPMYVPSVVVGGALRMIRGTVQKKAGFDTKELAPIKGAPKCTTPMLLGHGNADEFIPEHHGRAIHEKYGGPKKLRLFDGDHNSLRPASFLDDGAQFLCEAMGAAPELACPSPPTRRSRLPWSSGGGSRFTYAASDHVDDPELEATLMLSLLDAQSGRGTNNTLRQQLEQQQQQQRQLMGDILMPEPAVAESEIVSKLTELGFTAEEAKEAYQHHKTTEGAVTYLLEKRR